MHITNLSISEVLRRAQEKSLTIPQFQRPFVWTTAQLKLLVDSISRNYPIGSLLLLTKSDNIKLASRSIEATIMNDLDIGDYEDYEYEDREQHYILDGQQRITSIVRVFLNGDPKRTYYFDLMEMVAAYDNEEKSWIIARKLDKTRATERREKNRLLRSDIVLNQSKTDIYVSEYIEDSEDFADYDISEKRRHAAKIKGIFEKIRNYQIPVVSIERNAQVESVCRIFETINSTGTRLTTFDLAVAKYFPRPDLRHFWESVTDKHSVLKEFEVDGERVLQVIVLSSHYKNGKFIEPTRTEMLTIDREVLEASWGRAIDSLVWAYNWAKANGARKSNLPSHGVITSIAALQASGEMNDGIMFHDKNASLRKWYFCKILQQGAKQAVNYRIGRDFQDLVQYFKGKSPLIYENVHLADIDIANLRGADVRYKAIMNIMYSSINCDFVTGEPLSDNNVEEHHIFPSSLNTKEKGRFNINSIANIIPILAETNRELSNRHPSEYINSILSEAAAKKTENQTAKKFADALFPGSSMNPGWGNVFRVGNYDQFILERSRLILNTIREIIGDALIEQEASLED